MNAHERFVRALRDACDAYEEAHCGKAKKRRRRGPVASADDVEVSEETRATARAHMDRLGLLKVG